MGRVPCHAKQWPTPTSSFRHLHYQIPAWFWPGEVFQGSPIRISSLCFQPPTIQNWCPNIVMNYIMHSMETWVCSKLSCVIRSENAYMLIQTVFFDCTQDPWLSFWNPVVLRVGFVQTEFGWFGVHLSGYQKQVPEFWPICPDVWSSSGKAQISRKSDAENAKSTPAHPRQSTCVVSCVQCI